MFFGETVAVVVFFMVSGLCAVTTVASVTWLINKCVQGYLNYLQNELELRRYVADTQVERARLINQIPLFVDPRSDNDLDAWRRAVRETSKVTPH